jgi:8-hydroxy-5-deazaflavin:NADPH oxidoreductase
VGASVQAASEGSSIDSAVVVLAVPYAAAAPIVQQYGDQLAGKIIVDITNPVDFTTMSPAVPGDTSVAEEIAKVAPTGAKVVKAFNTTFAGTLIAGQVAGQPLDVFIAGDDADAKTTISRLVTSGGLRAVDTGPLRRARQLEALGLLHMALQFTLNTGFGSYDIAHRTRVGPFWHSRRDHRARNVRYTNDGQPPRRSTPFSWSAGPLPASSGASH